MYYGGMKEEGVSKKEVLGNVGEWGRPLSEAEIGKFSVSKLLESVNQKRGNFDVAREYRNQAEAISNRASFERNTEAGVQRINPVTVGMLVLGLAEVRNDGDIATVKGGLVNVSNIFGRLGIRVETHQELSALLGSVGETLIQSGNFSLQNIAGWDSRQPSVDE